MKTIFDEITSWQESPLVTWYLESKAPERTPALLQGCDAVVRYPGDVLELLEVL